MNKFQKKFNSIKRILKVNQNYIKHSDEHYSKKNGHGYLILVDNRLGILVNNKQYGKIKHLLDDTDDVYRSYKHKNSHFYISIYK